MLRTLGQLKSLDLAHNQLGPLVGRAMAGALAACSSLERLDLSWNPLGSAVQHLGWALIAPRFKQCYKCVRACACVRARHSAAPRNAAGLTGKGNSSRQAASLCDTARAGPAQARPWRHVPPSPLRPSPHDPAGPPARAPPPHLRVPWPHEHAARAVAQGEDVAGAPEVGCSGCGVRQAAYCGGAVLGGDACRGGGGVRGGVRGRCAGRAVRLACGAHTAACAGHAAAVAMQAAHESWSWAGRASMQRLPLLARARLRRCSQRARSGAPPVVMPSFKSTVTVNAVYMASSFSAELTMSGRRRRSSAGPSMPMQITPLVYSTMYAMASGVTWEWEGGERVGKARWQRAWHAERTACAEPCARALVCWRTLCRLQQLRVGMRQVLQQPCARKHAMHARRATCAPTLPPLRAPCLPP